MGTGGPGPPAISQILFMYLYLITWNTFNASFYIKKCCHYMFEAVTLQKDLRYKLLEIVQNLSENFEIYSKNIQNIKKEY